MRVAAAFAILLLAAAQAAASDAECLACHGQQGLTKSFPKGEALSLHVDGAAQQDQKHMLRREAPRPADVGVTALIEAPQAVRLAADADAAALADATGGRVCRGEP